jgi:hypothetical protein
MLNTEENLREGKQLPELDDWQALSFETLSKLQPERSEGIQAEQTLRWAAGGCHSCSVWHLYLC